MSDQKEYTPASVQKSFQDWAFNKRIITLIAKCKEDDLYVTAVKSF